MPTLNDLAGSSIWVAWRGEPRADNPNKITKMPYDPQTGEKARSDDPDTWGSRRAAERRARRIANGAGGGIGVVLGIDCGDGTALGGVDLDTCRSVVGDLDGWAQEVIDRFATYTEISPSGTGAKMFFRYRGEDLPRLRGLMGAAEHGKMFKRGGGDHPPAIELHLSNRYFTVTGDVVGVADLRLVEFADLKWLLTEAGPAFVNGSAGRDGLGGHRPRDESRSGAAFRLGLRMRREGKGFEEFCEAVSTDPETAEWYQEKGAASGERELHRIWRRAERPSGPPWQIDLKAPYATARLFRRLQYDADDAPTLHYHRSSFYGWNGTAYPEVEQGDVRSQVYRFLDRCVVPVLEKETSTWQQTPVKPNTSLVNNVLDGLRAAAQLPATVAAPVWLDDTTEPAPEELIACSNGLLHLPTLELLPHSPAFFTHNALDYGFDPAAPMPIEWLSFLRQLWPNDAAAIATLRQIFGYCLTADTSRQKAFLIVGPKRSGKGTIARVLRRLVGANNAAAPTLAGLGTNFGLAPLIGKRVAIISDARLGGRADQAAIAERLLSITGEDALTIDRKYRDAWTGRLGVRFLVLTNELPRLADASGALASRFVVLELTKSFYGREDLGLTNKLLAELPGILNWSIEGWRRLRRRGHFTQPASAEDAIADLEALGSPVGAFVRERCEAGPGKRENAGKMFREWCDWCETQGRDKPGTKQSFGRDLRAAVPGLRTRRRNDGGRFYEGVTLRPLA